MLVKLLFTSNDYEKSLRRRRVAALALLGIGLIGFSCWLFLVPGNSLSEYAQGFYLGASSGITAGAVILLCRTQYLLTHPEARKKAQIKETDERERSIVHSAFQAAGVVTFFTAVGALFVVLPISPHAFYALLAVMVLYCLSFLIALQILEKRL